MATRASAFVGMLVTLLISTSLFADELDTELTAFGGYRLGGSFDVQDTDGSYEWQDSSSFGLIWNHPYKDNTEWEVFLSQQSSNAEFSGTATLDPEVDVETTTLQIGGTYLWEGVTVQRYLVATIGGTHIKAESQGSESDTFLSGSMGLGVKIAPTSRLGLRLEARWIMVLTSNSTDLFCRTGPDLNVCAVAVEGDLFNQVETFAGVVFRF